MCSCGEACAQPAVDHERRAGDVARLIGGKKADEGGDLVGCTDPSQGLCVENLPLGRRRVGVARPPIVAQRGADITGADRVYADVGMALVERKASR